MNRGIAAGVAAGVVVGLAITGLAVVGGGGDDDVMVVDPGSTTELDGPEVITRWAGLDVSADRRTVTVSTALPLDPCAEEDRLVLEVRPDEGVVVVQPTFIVPPLDETGETACTLECTAIEMSVTAPEPLPPDATFVPSPDAVTSCAEGVPLDT